MKIDKEKSISKKNLCEDSILLTRSRLPCLRRQLLAATFGCSNGVIFGMFVGYLSVGLDSLKVEWTKGRAPYEISDVQMEILGSVLTMAAAIGSLASGEVATRFGRKWTSLIMTIPHVFSWALIAASQNYSMLFAAFVLGGLAEGVRSTTTRLYLGEAAHPMYRGQFLSAIFLTVITSSLVQYLMALILNWQYLAVFNALLPLLFVPFHMKLPETHHWLITQNRHEEAKQALQWFYGDHYDCEAEFLDHVKHQAQAEASKPTFRQILHWNYMKPIMVVFTLTVLRQYAGGTVAMMYMSQIFRKSHSSLEPKYAVIVMGFCEFIVLVLAGYMFDRFGRKKTVLLSGIVMGLGNGAMGAYLNIEETPSMHEMAEKLDWMPICFLAVSLIGHSLGIASVINLVTVELVPTQVRDLMGGVFNTMNNVCIAICVGSFHYLFDLINPSGTFYLFGICCFILAAFFEWAVPETKGEALDAIDDKIQGGGHRKDKRNNPGDGSDAIHDLGGDKISILFGGSEPKIVYTRAPSLRTRCLRSTSFGGEYVQWSRLEKSA